MAFETEIFTNMLESWIDYPDKDSNSIVVYFTGCAFNCIGCHNAELKGDKLPEDLVVKVDAYELYKKLIKLSERLNGTRKVVFQGGDPLYIKNIDTVRDFLKINKIFDVCIYTGCDIETVKSLNIHGFKFIKCGQFVLEKYQQADKTEERMVLASTNQEIYDAEYNKLSVNGILTFGGN